VTHANKTRRRGKAEKPAKPYPEFPLFPHATRRWAKKIRGKLFYFGPWHDPQGALQRYVDQKDALHAGRTPREPSDGVTIRDVCNRFLNAKRHLLDAGEIAPRTFAEYHNACRRVVEAFGRTRRVDDLQTTDFEAFRRTLAKKQGPVSLGNEIQRVRTLFKFAYDEGLIDRPIRYGQSFRKPSRKTIRLARAANGRRMFEQQAASDIVAVAGGPLAAMVLLGLNCGFGQSDCANLPLSAVDLRAGRIDFPRPKTGIERRCPLWPETVEALRKAIEGRPAPLDKADEGLVFVTTFGRRWVREDEKGKHIDAVRQEFDKVLNALGIKRKGLGFYALRHTFRTIADECRDQVAVDYIMGHARDDMASLYRERISDERLRAVTDHVHDWLFGESGEGEA